MLLYLGAFALLGLAALGGVLLWLNQRGDGSDRLAATMRKAGCTYSTLKSQGGKHVETSPPAGFKYNSTPPTSGPMTNETAVWGFYDEPVNPTSTIHNLEHSGIVINYGPRVPKSTVEQLRQFYNNEPNAIVVAPLPALGKQVAIAAWTRLSTCPEFSESAFAAFRDAHRYGGVAPERAPAGSFPPGSA